MKNVYVCFLVFFFCATEAIAQCWQFVDAGFYHTLAIKTDGSLWAWGWNPTGQLGDGTQIQKNSPIQVGNGNNWKSVAAGTRHSLAIKTDGTLWAWGYNTNGELGDGSTIYKTTPIQIGNATNWKTVAAGEFHSLAIKTDGTLWTWGSNNSGQLGDGTNVDKHVPTQIGTDADWNAITCGSGHSMALKNNGTLWAWGENQVGQLGNGANSNLNTPTQVGSSLWQAIAAGYGHSLGIKTDGTLWAWGYNNDSQLGIGGLSTGINKNSPVNLGFSNNWVHVAAGGNHSSGLKQDGTLWAWGNNTNCQLGDGTSGPGNKISVPTLIGTDTNWQSTSSGESHSIGIKKDGTLLAWGSNIYGQLGTGASSLTVCTQDNIYCFPLGTRELPTLVNSLIVYPNPCKNDFQILQLNNVNVEKMVIFDFTGKVVLRSSTIDLRINVQNFNPGIYTIVFFSKGIEQSVKFIKE